MRHFYRFIILSIFLFSNSTHALTLFLDAIDWRVTETNDWAYINSETLPHQNITYKTIDFNYTPGFRIGVSYVCSWDALFSYTRLYTSTNDAANGPMQPAFLGSVTAKPTPPPFYLYESGRVNQKIDYNIFDLDFGKRFYPAESLMLHPIIGLMGGWINQEIHAAYQGTTVANERLTNNFSGIGPKVGIDTDICFFNYHDFQPKLTAAFAASYLFGHWNIQDVTKVNPPKTVLINGASHSMGALTLQGALGIKVDYKKFALKFVYEVNDWFDQNQFFDNDTGAHNNDLVLQGLTLGFSYSF